MSAYVMEGYSDVIAQRKAEGKRLNRAVRTLRKQAASRGERVCTLSLKAQYLGIHTPEFDEMPRKDRHHAVSCAFSKRLMA